MYGMIPLPLEIIADICRLRSSKLKFRRMAENWFAPLPLWNFADISYLVENIKMCLLRDIYTLCIGALVCKSM